MIKRRINKINRRQKIKRLVRGKSSDDLLRDTNNRLTDCQEIDKQINRRMMRNSCEIIRKMIVSAFSDAAERSLSKKWLTVFLSAAHLRRESMQHWANCQLLQRCNLPGVPTWATHGGLLWIDIECNQNTGRSLWWDHDGWEQLLLPTSIAAPNIRSHSTRIHTMKSYLLRRWQWTHKMWSDTKAGSWIWVEKVKNGWEFQSPESPIPSVSSPYLAWRA